VLRNTFLHLPGVGEATERRWWRQGRTDWSAALAAAPSREDQRRALEDSLAAHAAGNWSFFEQALSHAHKWRAWGDLKDRAVFVDIETDGGTEPDSITVIGAFDGHTVHHFVADENMQDAADFLEQFPLLVSYNGALFDLPLLRERFTHRLQNYLQLDLRFPLHRLGHRGGLKQIERQVGLERSAETIGLGGWDAVRLWREWQWGSTEAREVLLAYNAEDVRNLLPLAELVYKQMLAQTPIPQS